MELEFVLLLLALFVIAILYSSVGHGGASGYLAVLSLTSYGLMEHVWLKQHVWFLNLLVSSLAFYHYNKQGFHEIKLSFPFIIASIPMAFIGGYMIIDGMIYDILLSITLIWAAYKLYFINTKEYSEYIKFPTNKQAIPWGAGIGFASGIIGVGGGIFLSPIILIKKWANPKTVASTAALFIFVNSIAGLAGASVSGQLILDIDILIYFTIAVFTGGFIGSYWGSKIASQELIQKILVIVLLTAASKRIIELLL